MTRTLATLIVATGVLVACNPAPTEDAHTAPDEVRAEVLAVRAGAIPETYTTTGTLIADDRVEIASRLMGYIRALDVAEGSKVVKGQRLLTIDPTEIKAQLQEAEARLAQARARAAEAQTDFERHRSLFEKQLIAASLYHKVELARQVAEEELRAAAATLERIRVQRQYAEIRSPVDGIVVERFRQTGDLATPGTPLLAIENPDNIVLRTFIREAHLRHVRPGDRLTIEVDATDLVTDGIVTQVVPSAEPQTYLYLVKAALERRDGVRSGMFARAHFAVGEHWGITLPADAVVSRADIAGVYLVDDTGVAHFRMIRTGRRLGTDIEVLSGLVAGDRVALHWQRPLRSGDRVLAEPTGDPGTPP